MYLLLGIFFILIGCVYWYITEMKNLSNKNIFVSILIILFGVVLFLNNIEYFLIQLNLKAYSLKLNSDFFSWLFVLGLIYLGTVCYTIASYYHLKFNKWNFIQALLIAIPFVIVEYNFSLRGNYYAKKHLMMNAVQITLITMIFYFINSWLLNYFVLKNQVIWWRESIAFLFIIFAFIITTHQPNRKLTS